MYRNTHRPRSAAAIIIITTALVSISFSAVATTYIGIYADDAHTECAWYAVPYLLASFYVWVQPGEDGLICAEYEITTPSNVIQAATIVNPAAGYHIGDAIVPPGSTVCFAECQTGWIWTHQLQCLVTDVNPSIIALDPHDDYGILRAANCTDSVDPYETMTKINDLFLNQGCCLSNEQTSWGAIKSLMK